MTGKYNAFVERFTESITKVLARLAPTAYKKSASFNPLTLSKVRFLFFNSMEKLFHLQVVLMLMTEIRKTIFSFVDV